MPHQNLGKSVNLDKNSSSHRDGGVSIPRDFVSLEKSSFGSKVNLWEKDFQGNSNWWKNNWLEWRLGWRRTETSERPWVWMLEKWRRGREWGGRKRHRWSEGDLKLAETRLKASHPKPMREMCSRWQPQKNRGWGAEERYQKRSREGMCISLVLQNRREQWSWVGYSKARSCCVDHSRLDIKGKKVGRSKEPVRLWKCFTQ